MTLEAEEGLIHDYSYTDQGYLEAEKVRNGTDGTPVTLRKLSYFTRSVGDLKIYPVSKEEVFIILIL